MGTKLKHDNMDMLLAKLGSAMATSSAFLTHRDKRDAMDNFGIKGQGLITNRSQEGSMSLQTTDMSASSRPSSSSGTSGDAVEAIGSFSMPQEAVGVIETVVNMNKALEQQIDTLRIRLNVESKNFETERQKIIQEKEKVISKKEDELETLKETLVDKDDKIGELVKEGHHKDLQIQKKEKEISDLKDLVKSTEEYAEQLQKRITKIRNEPHHSSNADSASSEHLVHLKQEITTLKEKVNSMEQEVTRAKHIIDQQNTKINGLETEKGVLTDKFKDELEKASRAMRSEVERMREVMKQQYAEMRNLRLQNVEISTDVRDIKHILLGNAQAEQTPRQNEALDTGHFKSPRPGQKSSGNELRHPMTSRLGHTVKATPTVRSSLPSPLSKQAPGINRDQTSLPPIKKNETIGSKWIPAGTRQSTLHAKSFGRGTKK